MKKTNPAYPQPHRFEHEAMATTFAIHIHHADPVYARQAAMEAFRQCDRLEEELSRFVEYSSISRLNRTPPEVRIPIHADAYVCLKQALHIADLTEGAFDVGFRSRKVQGLKTYAPPVRLGDDSVSASPRRPEPDLDLGAIGKGYAIDKMAELLCEWSIESALVTGGGSSLLAIGSPPEKAGWPISLSSVSKRQHYLPSGWSISASGFEVREDHVQDPTTGTKAGHALRTWAIAPAAAVSDALSTAFLAMPRNRVLAFVQAWPECGVAIEYASDPPVFAGIPVPFF